MIDEDRSTWTLSQLAAEVIEACELPMGCRSTIIAALHDAKEQGKAAAKARLGTGNAQPTREDIAEAIEKLRRVCGSAALSPDLDVNPEDYSFCRNDIQFAISVFEDVEPQSSPVAGDSDAEFWIYDGVGEYFATTSGPRATALKEACRYASQVEGPRIEEVTRRTVEPREVNASLGVGRDIA